MEEEILNQVQTPFARRNPFDEGIAKAISSTRSNLGMSRDQEHRAINNALLALGNGLAGEPVQRGFKNNLDTVLNVNNFFHYFCLKLSIYIVFTFLLKGVLFLRTP